MRQDSINNRVLVQQIALYLGKPWKMNNLEPLDWRFEIIDGTGRCLYFRLQKDRFKISGSFPNRKTLVYRNDYKSIGVSTSRHAKDIAADISRRLLPHYLKAYDRTMERYKEDKAKKDRLFLIAQILVKVTRGRLDNYGGSSRGVYFDKGKADIWSDEKIQLELRNLTIEQAIQVVSVLKNEDHKMMETNGG